MPGDYSPVRKTFAFLLALSSALAITAIAGRAFSVSHAWIALQVING